MITIKDFKKQVSKPFGIEMHKHGFKGTGLEYFKKTDDFLIAVYISPGRWGGNCSVGFAIHPKQVDKGSAGTKDLTKLKLYQYEFKMKTIIDGRGEWWDFSDMEGTNLETLAQILRSIKQVALPIIDRLTSSPGILDSFDVTEMDNFYQNWTMKTGVSIPTTDIRFAWAMTLIFEKKDLNKAKQFAEWGFSHLVENDSFFGIKDFKRVLKKNDEGIT